MSRIRHFTRNLAASYFQLGVNVVYSLASIPLILHYLPNAEFGLWAMLVQLMGYVSLIDMGMTSAVARLLVDYKDHREEVGYGSLIQTSFLVSAVQGAIILGVVLASAPLLASVMKIPAEHAQTFSNLLRLQGAIVAFGFVFRPLGVILSAHQREYFLTLTNAIVLVVTLGLLWVFLQLGRGIYSFILANMAGALLAPTLLLWSCRHIDALPLSGRWGKATWAKFLEVFSYGKDVFLMNLGGQLVMSSQTIIVSRVLGLDVAAAWAVGTKLFNLCMPLITRPLFIAMPALSEMVVRREESQLRLRLRNLIVLVGSLGVFMGISYGLCNSLFVGIWTQGKIHWPPLNDWLLGIWMCVIAMQAAHCNFLYVTKEIGGGRYILFLEGISFVLLAVFFGSAHGIPGIVTCSIACTLAFSYQYSLRRTCRHFNCGVVEVAFRWIGPSLKFVVAFGAAASLAWFAGSRLEALPRLILNVLVAGGAGGVLFLKLGCPPQLLKEMAGRLPSPLSRWAGHFVQRA